MIWPDNLPEWVRLVQASVFCLAFYGLSQRLGRRWKGLSRSVRRIALWFYALLFTGAWGTLETLQEDIPIPLGSRNWLILFVVSGLLVAVLVEFEGDDSTAPVYRLDRSGPLWSWRLRKLR